MGRECDCLDRSWYGREHDSACALAGQPRGKATLTITSNTAPVHLDASDVATILAALRYFQSTYEDCDSVSIADAWPMHFAVSGEGDELEVTPEPLGTEDIDSLCERINCAKILVLP